MLSVICPIYNEEKYIGQCVESILAQDYPKDDLEILFVDGMSTDDTRCIVVNYSNEYPFIKLFDNPKRIVPCAMNIGIKASKGDIIIRLDAHASYPTNYFSALIGRIVELDADNVGVVCKTDVLNKTPKTLAIREVLSNKFGVGNSVFRTGVDKVMKVDTVPFGCYRRDTFERFGMYDERLIRNQDFELNYRIRKGNGRIFIVPDSYCTYFARETFKKLWIQNYKNGLWGIRTVLFAGNSNSLALRHYIPMIFVLSLIVPLFASLLWIPFMGIAGLSLLAYLLMIGGVSLCIGIQKHLNILYLLLGFASLHLSNGCGMLVSLFTANSYVRRINAQR